jgi:hypothetical protein
MRRTLVLLVAGALVVLATSCYRDFDFGIDGKADRWYADLEGDWWDAASGQKVLDGQPGDVPVPADWDGDHIWDKGVLRPNGDWVTGSSLGTINFPAPPQLPGYHQNQGFHILPVPGDYDGDGDVEPAWYRDTDARWFIHGGGDVQFGRGPTFGDNWVIPDQDFPVPADYDGDGVTDLATFHPRTQFWSVHFSSDGSVSTTLMKRNRGLPLPIPADYDGDGRDERATAGYEGWDIEGQDLQTFGEADGNYPAVADYDGDNRVDLSYVTGAGLWRTFGSAETFQMHDELNYGVYPLATGHNLIWNIARFTFVGEVCYFNPDPLECP